MILDVWGYGDVEGVYTEIRYMIQNIGNASARASTTEIYIDGSKVAEHNASPLNPGEYRVERFHFREPVRDLSMNSQLELMFIMLSMS